jgi:PKD repeat protein
MRFLFVLLITPCWLCGQVNLSLGLIAHYPFTGNANDVSGNNINGVVTNAVLTTDKTNAANSAYYFNGRDSYIQLPFSNLYNFSAYSSFSISLWVLPDPGNSWPAQALLVKSPYNYDFNESIWNYGCYLLDYKAMSGYAYEHILNSKTQFSYDKCWYNIITTYDKGNWKLYINGRLESSDLSQTRFVSAERCKITFGKKGESSGDWYKGKMDDVRIYSRVLNEQEIKAIAVSCKQNPCANNKPSAAFTYNITNCLEVQFRLKQKNYDIKSIKWLFGDGTSSVETSSSHIYKKPGTYKAKVIVINKAGCADTVTNEIKLQALNTDFVFTEYGEPGQIHFKAKNNKASYNWNFDDGQTIENETAISHTFTQTSTFKVNMYAKNSLGCTDTVSKYVNINLPNLITDSIAAPLATPVIAEAIAPSTTLLEKREKEILENIIVNTDSLLVSVYDNGIIDGDSVTLIFNDKIIAVHQLLSSKPYTFAIVLDKNLPANELMMYAENLGSIPPNTSLIIINDGPVKHQLNISSNKKTNGTISFTLKNKNNSR